jgi:hypothetical protein
MTSCERWISDMKRQYQLTPIEMSIFFVVVNAPSCAADPTNPLNIPAVTPFIKPLTPSKLDIYVLRQRCVIHSFIIYII